MNPLAVVSGVSGGYGVFRLWRGLLPHRVPLAEVLARANARMDPRPILRPAERRSPATWVGRRAENAERLLLPSVRADLRVVGKSMPQHLGEKVGLAVAGLLVPAASASALAIVGLSPPPGLFAILGTAMAAFGFVIPDVAVRSQAAKRRREFRHGQALYVWLITSALAGGSGIDGALYDCAAVGLPKPDAMTSPGEPGSPGWVLRYILAAVRRARLTRQPASAGLRQLAVEVGVDELGEVASTVALTDAHGAKARDSLKAKARSLSVRVRSEIERNAHRLTDEMIGPVMFLVGGLLLFFLYPPAVHLFTAR